MSIGALGLAGVLLFLLGQLKVQASFAGAVYSVSVLYIVAFLMALTILLAVVFLVRQILREFRPQPLAWSMA
jgi:membrane-bound ClpP family serine protease